MQRERDRDRYEGQREIQNRNGCCNYQLYIERKRKKERERQNWRMTKRERVK